MPSRLVGFSRKLKMTTASTIVKTCFTLAVEGRNQNQRHLLKKNSDMFPRREKPLTRHRHRERARLLVRRERDHVEAERDRAVDGESDRLLPRHLGRAVYAHLLEFARPPAEKDALHERERTHTDEEVERVQLQAADLDAVRDDGLERGEDCARQGEDKAPRGERVVAVRGKGDAGDDGNEREVGLPGMPLAEHDHRDDDGEERSHGSDNLVELSAGVRRGRGQCRIHLDSK